MALIISGQTKCPLCRAIINQGDEIVATRHFIADSEDSLWRFSDAAMHKTCFLIWDQRQEFIRKYNQTVGSIIWGNGTSHFMTDDGSIISRQQQDS